MAFQMRSLLTTQIIHATYAVFHTLAQYGEYNERFGFGLS